MSKQNRLVSPEHDHISASLRECWQVHIILPIIIYHPRSITTTRHVVESVGTGHRRGDRGLGHGCHRQRPAGVVSVICNVSHRKLENIGAAYSIRAFRYPLALHYQSECKYGSVNPPTCAYNHLICNRYNYLILLGGSCSTPRPRGRKGGESQGS